MKKILVKISVMALFVVLFVQNSYSAIYTVGGTNPNYATLQLAFAAINSGAITGQITLQITGSTNETVLPQLNASGTGSANYTSVLIYPTGTFTISTALNSAAIDLNGADNVTIDGRINGTGTPNSLTITGTNTGNGAAGIRFVNSAENNTIKYCTITASSTSSAIGVVTFGGSSSGNGNDSNIVEYCNITCSGSNRPYNGFLSSGTGGRENNNCIIRNNNIYNTFQTGFSSNGININSASVGFTISGNSIYETSPFTSTGNALAYNAIRVSTLSEHTISGNYIGGSGPLCTGTWSFVGQRAVYFCGIYAYAGTAIASTISNNNIANIDFSSKEDNPWDGIFLFSGNFEVTGNTIGATTGTGSIVCRTPVPVATTTISGGIVTAINLLYGGSDYSATPPTITFTAPPAGGTAPTVTATVSGGVITGFTDLTGGSGYTTAPSVIFDGQSNNYSTSHGLIQNSTGTVNINGNNIGSITTVGSDYYSHGFESIYVRTIAATTTLTNNLIGSLTTPNSIYVSSAAASSLIKQDVYGLYSASTGTTTILGNTVANLTNAYSGVNAGSRNRGIQTIAGSNTISNNTVYNLTSVSKQTAGGTSASAIGISQTSATAGTTQTVNGNTVYNILNTQNTAAKSCVTGIYYNGPTTGTHTISGNFVHSLSLSSTNVASDMEGIELANGVFTCANNIISIGTGITGGYVMNGIWDESTNSLTRNLYFNTVYIGGTVSSGASATTALRSTGNTATRNYRNNILDNVRTGGGTHYAIYLVGTTSLTIGYNDYVGTLYGITLNTAPDNNSLAINPQFANAGGTSAINYYPSATLTGVSGTGITTDYYNITRHVTTPKMGALEQNGNVWQGTNSTDFNTASNWANNAVPTSGADIIFATSPTNDCVLDVDRIVGNITNGSSKNLVVNGHTLTVNNSLNFTSSGKINTSTASSVVKFAGSASQTIPTAVFVSNTIAGLEITNSNGATLEGSLTVSAGLTLTSGTLTVGANTLTITGNSISRTSGNIDASNSSAAIVFENTSAIILPASVFTGDIQQLTLNTTSGITAGSGLSVTGNINLNAANPSATKGLLDMASNTLEMKVDATISGIGDITGIVRRAHTFTSNLPYAFGSQFTTFTFIDEGTRPSWIDLKISIGAVPGWSSWTPSGKVARYYNIAVSDNSSTAKAVVNMRYLVNELDATNNDESKLVFWHKYTGFNSGLPHEHGKSNQNFDDHYIGVTGILLSGAATENLNDSEIALAYSSTTKNTWKGEVAGSQTLWEVAGNWSAGHAPLSSEDVLIPGGLTYYPSLTTSSSATAKSIEIESGASITANDYDIVITGFQGAWINDGNFFPGTGKVTFNHGVTAEIVTISGITNFYDIEAGENTTMQPVAGCILRIAGAGTAYITSIVDFSTIENTVEWNGAGQTIVNPSGLNGHSGFYNLILSGSGTKTMPASAMNVRGDLTISGTTSATAAGALSIGGNLIIGTGTTLGTGTYSHEIKGNITCDGTLTPGTGSVISMNGSSAQTIQGTAATIALGGLTVSNTSGVTLYNHATTAALDISSGAFTVTAGKSVTASGNTTLGSAHCLVLKSDENGTASFIDNGTISGSGTAKVERYITPYDEVSDMKFHFLSSPVSSTQAIAPEFIDLSSELITDFYRWDETSTKWISYRLGNYGTGEYNSYNGDFGNLNFEPGNGYMVAYPSAVTKNFVGTPNTSSAGINIACSKTSGGWNLIGNPFPSSVDWSSANVERTNVDAALYFYDNATLSYTYYVNLTGGTGTATQYIAPMQGFMVHASSSTGNVKIINAARTHAGQDVFYKDVALTTNILNLKVEGNGKTDYARVCFYAQATENFDGDFDAFKLFSYSETNSELYSVSADLKSLAINTLPVEIMDGGLVPVSFKVGTQGNYTLTADEINSFATNTYITLEDKITGAFQKLNDNPVYAFSASLLDITDRFVLHFKDATSVSEPEKPEEAIKAWYQNGSLTVRTGEGITNVGIFNVQGQNLQNYQLHGSGLQDVPINLSTGVYFARLINDGQMQTIKLIIQ